MKTQFEILIEERMFKVINMNVQNIQLLQVFTDVGGIQQRFHIYSDNGRDLHFAMPEFVPAEVLSYERQLSEGINEFYSSPEGQA